MAPLDSGAKSLKDSMVRKRKERIAVGSYLLVTALLTGSELLVDARFDLDYQALHGCSWCGWSPPDCMTCWRPPLSSSR